MTHTAQSHWLFVLLYLVANHHPAIPYLSDISIIRQRQYKDREKRGTGCHQGNNPGAGPFPVGHFGLGTFSTMPAASTSRGNISAASDVKNELESGRLLGYWSDIRRLLWECQLVINNMAWAYIENFPFITELEFQELTVFTEYWAKCWKLFPYSTHM